MAAMKKTGFDFKIPAAFCDADPNIAYAGDVRQKYKEMESRPFAKPKVKPDFLNEFLELNDFPTKRDSISSPSLIPPPP